MEENQQAVYNAVRSRISSCDVATVISETITHIFDVSSVIVVANDMITEVGHAATRPSVLFKPSLSLDGATWVALYGNNLQEGCVGCGDTPEKAMAAFDVEWWKPTRGVKPNG